jgi:hypothetical protein
MFLTAAVLVGVLPVDDALSADRGIQLSRDGARVLVNKDVGAERFAITLNLSTGTVIGNVFAGGGDPTFIFCEPEGAADTYGCEGAGPCTTATCVDQYADFGVVTLPADFFELPAAGPAATRARRERSAGAAALAGSARATASIVATSRAAEAATAAAAGRGFQLSPDGQHVLASKDIGQQRWAITLNRSDRTVTGNVFFADGGEPAFLSCQQELRAPETFTCYGAGACATPGCPGDQYAFIATVTLPADFFGPQTCGNGRLESSERCDPPGGGCAVICGVDELCVIEIGVAPVPIPGVCSDDCGACRLD